MCLSWGLRGGQGSGTCSVLGGVELFCGNVFATPVRYILAIKGSKFLALTFAIYITQYVPHNIGDTVYVTIHSYFIGIQATEVPIANNGIPLLLNKVQWTFLKASYIHVVSNFIRWISFDQLSKFSKSKSRRGFIIGQN